MKLSLTLQRGVRAEALSLGIAALLLLSLPAAAAEFEHITPYRPSVSNSAQLPVPGQLELELGILAAQNDARRNSLPYLFKLAFNERWGILVGGEALVTQHGDDGQLQRGVGNTAITAKRAFVINDATAYGLEFGANLPTARESIGGGKTDLTINSIVSHDLGRVHLDANANLTRVGAIEVDTGRVQTGLSAALSTVFVPGLTLTTELSGTRRAGVPTTAQALLALAYSPSSRMTIDIGVTKGLRADAHDWSFFSGLVVPIARLW